jgi:hypothetical protein
VRTIDQLTIENGHQAFYAIEDIGGIIIDMNRNLHMFMVNDAIESHNHRMYSNTMDARKYDLYERENIDLTQLVVKSRLTKKMREAIRTRFDHDPQLYDYLGSVAFMAALDICNASYSYDIEGAQKKLDDVTLEAYP